MPDSVYETWFMEGRLKAGKHFVRVVNDFADLEDKILHYEKHPQEAREIIRNANAYIVDVEIVKLAGRTVAAEILRPLVAHLTALQKLRQLFQVFRPHLLFDAVGAQRPDRTANEEPRLIEAVAKRIAGVAANDQTPF